MSKLRKVLHPRDELIFDIPANCEAQTISVLVTESVAGVRTVVLITLDESIGITTVTPNNIHVGKNRLCRLERQAQN